MIGLLIIACIAPLLIKGPSGEPLMTLEDWKIALPIQLKGLVGNLNDGVKESLSVQEPQPMKVYKWLDDEGQWNFSSAPSNFEVAEEVGISAVNLMEAHVPPARQSDFGPSAVSKSVSVSPGILKPESVREMMETIEQFQQTID